jgi:hypothetical protein
MPRNTLQRSDVQHRGSAARWPARRRGAANERATRRMHTGPAGGRGQRAVARPAAAPRRAAPAVRFGAVRARRRPRRRRRGAARARAAAPAFRRVAGGRAASRCSAVWAHALREGLPLAGGRGDGAGADGVRPTRLRARVRQLARAGARSPGPAPAQPWVAQMWRSGSRGGWLHSLLPRSGGPGKTRMAQMWCPGQPCCGARCLEPF